MTSIRTVTTFISAMALALLLSACNSDTSQGKSNSESITTPATPISEGTAPFGTNGMTAFGDNTTDTATTNVSNTDTTTDTATETGGSEGVDTNTAQTSGDTSTTAHTDNGGSEAGATAQTGGNATDTQTNNNANNGGTMTTHNANNATNGGSDNTPAGGNTTGGGDGNTATTPTVTLKSLKLTIDKTSLNKDTNTTVKVIATYSDNTTKEVTDKVEWVATPKDALKVTGTTLAALKDVNVTLQAKAGTTLSNKIKLHIYWEVDGHRLPPEPDPKVNNATLLGIDSNHNGVRDDVERWIYTQYKEYIPCHQELDWNNTAVIDGKTIPSAVEVCEDHPVPYHPVVRAVAMQGARAAQIIIQEPEKARESLPIWDKALDCYLYISKSRNKDDKKLIDHYIYGDNFKKIQFNTIMRARAFAKFNFYLSGGVYESTKSDDLIRGCNEEVKALLKDLR